MFGESIVVEFDGQIRDENRELVRSWRQGTVDGVNAGCVLGWDHANDGEVEAENIRPAKNIECLSAIIIIASKSI